MKLRWENYFIRKGEACKKFLDNHFESDGEKKILFILGIGLDLRCCDGLKTIVNMGLNNIKCLAIEINEGLDSPTAEYISWVEKNFKKIKELISPSKLKKEIIDIFDRNNRRVGSKMIIKILRNTKKVDLQNYTDIILDVSALPRYIFFPMITEILNQIDKKYSNLNFYIIVSENSELDKIIKHKILEENISFFPSFGKYTSMQSLEDVPRIWIPILGEDKTKELEKIYNELKPEEICPILPFPAKNPRRCDDLVREYHKFLFDSAPVEPRNFIYAAEDNPFDVYRQIIYTSYRYSKSLEKLGGGVLIVSPLSSKIMTIGAAIAAYELSKDSIYVDVSYVGARGYSVSGDRDQVEKIVENSKLFLIWLTGECYE